MTRLIDADALKEHLHNDPLYPLVEKYGMDGVIDAQPTIDAEPVRHGKWLRISPAKIYECSECGQDVMTDEIECYRFCHNCGARMEEE